MIILDRNIRSLFAFENFYRNFCGLYAEFIVIYAYGCKSAHGAQPLFAHDYGQFFIHRNFTLYARHIRRKQVIGRDIYGVDAAYARRHGGNVRSRIDGIIGVFYAGFVANRFRSFYLRFRIRFAGVIKERYLFTIGNDLAKQCDLRFDRVHIARTRNVGSSRQTDRGRIGYSRKQYGYFSRVVRKFGRRRRGYSECQIGFRRDDRFCERSFVVRIPHGVFNVESDCLAFRFRPIFKRVDKAVFRLIERVVSVDLQDSDGYVGFFPARRRCCRRRNGGYAR